MLCGHLEGSDVAGARESQEEGDICVQIMIHYIVQQKLTKHCKATTPN